MAKFAVLNGNKISNVIIADTKEIAENLTNTTCIEILDSNVGLGYIYDSTTNSFMIESNE
jgi:hypothetical protein